jgi:hypothetical protein
MHGLQGLRIVLQYTAPALLQIVWLMAANMHEYPGQKNVCGE